MPLITKDRTPSPNPLPEGEGLNVVLDPAQAAAEGKLHDLAARVSTPHGFLRRKWKGSQGLYLWGGVGRGKTMLMDQFFDSLPTSVTKRRVHFHAFMIEVQNYLHGVQAREGNAALPNFAKRLAREARVLCFDEFHVTDIADAMILVRLFTTLFEAGLVVVATSNWPPDRLYEGGLQRDLFLPFIALLKQKLDVVQVDAGVDYRMRALAETEKYLWPLGAATTAKIDLLVHTLTGEAVPPSQTMEIKGRALDVHAAKGVARCGFALLCEQPRGAEDYLVLAHAFPTIILEGIPTLGYDRRNEAKRLMILIDTLYDARTRLIVTAAAPPDQLYRGADHAFEFQRTVSRLIEMQSAEWPS